MRRLIVNIDDVTYLQLQEATGGAAGAANAVVVAALRDWLDRMSEAQAERRRTALAIVPRKRKGRPSEAEDDETDVEEDEGQGEASDAPTTALARARTPSPAAVWHAAVQVGNRWQVRGPAHVPDVDYIGMLALHVLDGWVCIQRTPTDVLAWAEHDAHVRRLYGDASYKPSPWVHVWRIRGTCIEPWEAPRS